MSAVPAISPFDRFLAGSTHLTTAPGEPNAPAATPTSTAEPSVAPLAEDLRNRITQDVGPASSTRSVTRTASAKSVVPAATAAPTPREGSESPGMSAFDYFSLEGPPSKGKETGPLLSQRNDRNLHAMADVVEILDGRVDDLRRDVENMPTEATLRAKILAAKASREQASGAQAQDDSGSTGSVGTVDELEDLGERVEEVEQQLKNAVASNEKQEDHVQDLDERVRILETSVVAPPASNFSMLEMTNALAEQFAMIKGDQQTLDDAISFPGLLDGGNFIGTAGLSRLHGCSFTGLCPSRAGAHFKHLRILMPAADVRALRNAWDRDAHNARSVKMVAWGINDSTGSGPRGSGAVYSSDRSFQSGSGNFAARR
ncbi:hypothetical protein DFH06DRAFT_1294013 [Mycena polygramma]|nr:hypothetical protein DFH06DRAFT_1294013 [Mycena polygramma]